MIGGEPIFCPLDSTNYRIGPNDSDVAWTGDWGLRAVGDHFDWLEFEREVNIGGNPPQYEVQPFKIAKCIVELQTAAHTFNDVEYWVFTRRCMQAFRNTMAYFACQVYPRSENPSTDILVLSTVNDRFYLVQEFLDLYNEAVEAIQASPNFNKNRFKLRFSDHLIALGNGTAPNEGGISWTPYFTIQRSFTSRDNQPNALHKACWSSLDLAGVNRMFSDVQVTYEWDFESLRTQFQLWTESWGSTWFSAVQRGGQVWSVDPLNGLERFKRVPYEDVYAVKAYIALWKTA